MVLHLQSWESYILYATAKKFSCSINFSMDRKMYIEDIVKALRSWEHELENF